MINPTQTTATSDHNVPGSLAKPIPKNHAMKFAQTFSAATQASRSAYVPKAEPYSLSKHGSHRVGDIELVPGAPGYDFQKALPYLKEIAGRDKDLAAYLKRQGVADPLGEPVNPIVVELSAEDRAYLASLKEPEFNNQTLTQKEQAMDQATAGDDATGDGPQSSEWEEVEGRLVVDGLQNNDSDSNPQQIDTEVALGVVAEMANVASTDEELFSFTELIATQDYLRQRTQQTTEDLLHALNNPLAST